jgi:hypothetical protein
VSETGGLPSEETGDFHIQILHGAKWLRTAVSPDSPGPKGGAPDIQASGSQKNCGSNELFLVLVTKNGAEPRWDVTGRPLCKTQPSPAGSAMERHMPFCSHPHPVLGEAANAGSDSELQDQLLFGLGSPFARRFLGDVVRAVPRDVTDLCDASRMAFTVTRPNSEVPCGTEECGMESTRNEPARESFLSRSGVSRD